MLYCHDKRLVYKLVVVKMNFRAPSFRSERSRRTNEWPFLMISQELVILHLDNPAITILPA